MIARSASRSSRSIQHSLARIIILASGTALFLAGTGFVLYDLFSFRQAMVRKLSSAAQMIAYNAESALLFDDDESASTTLAALRADPHVTGGAIYGRDGRLFASYARSRGGDFEPLASAPPATRTHWIEKGRLRVLNTIRFEGNAIGSVYIESDLEESAARFRNYMGVVILFSLSALIIAMLVSTRLQKVILDPILHLVQTARVVSSRKDYTVRAKPHGEGEIGVLVTTFNEMLEQIQKRDLEVNEAREQLERRVEERTEDLRTELAERRRAEEALKKSETLLSEAQRMAHIGSWEWDITHESGLWSSELYQLLGLVPGSIPTTYQQYIERVHPEDRRAVAEAIDASLTHGTPFRVDHRLILPDGRARVFHAEGRVTLDAGGRPVRLLALAQDITEQRALEERREAIIRAEAARSETEAAQERESILARVTASFASSIDIEKTLTAAAELACTAFGDWCALDFAGPDGTPVRVAVARCDRQRVREIAELLDRRLSRDRKNLASIVLARGGTVVLGEQELLDLDDPEQVRLVELMGAGHALGVPLVIGGRAQGALTWVRAGQPFDPAEVLLAEQIAQRAAIAIEHAQLYREAREANQLKDEFLATLSHELRTPLQAIVGWAHLLQTKTLDPEAARKAIDSISRNAQAQNQLISDILDVSRIVAGKLRLNLRAVNLVEVIDAALDTVRPAAEAKQIRFEAILDPSAGPVSGDPDRLQQVVWNLLANAIKFVPRGGRVIVRLEPVNSHVEIVVEDNGPGVPSDFLPHIFERFRQADASSTRPHGGLGLGLAIVRHLVELHGGTVTARNRDAGSGAIFTLSFPRRSMAVASPAGRTGDEHPAAERALAIEHGPSLRGVRVLVVDDEPDARELIAMALELNGAAVIVAGTASEGYETLVRELPDVLLSDIEMPGQDGYEFIRSIRKLPRESGGATPAVALTAYASTDHRVRSLLAGFQIHVTKPAQPSELVTVVASLAGRSGRPGAA